MKSGMFTLALATALFSISCTKDAEMEVLDDSGERPAAIKAGNFVSNWESVPTWQSSVSNGVTSFRFKRTTPQLTKAQAERDAVVVWSKGYDFEGLSKGDKPLGLPFTWIPADERYMHPYKWYFEGSENNIAVGIDMHEQMRSSFLGAKDRIQMRYFVLSEDFMKAHALTGASLRSLSYDKLIGMLNVAP